MNARLHAMRLALGTLDRTRDSVATQAVGIAPGALDVATAYLKERHQFGQPLAAFQGLQFMVADMEIQVSAARALTHAAARELDAWSAPSRSTAPRWSWPIAINKWCSTAHRRGHPTPRRWRS